MARCLGWLEREKAYLYSTVSRRGLLKIMMMMMSGTYLHLLIASGAKYRLLNKKL